MRIHILNIIEQGKDNIVDAFRGFGDAWREAHRHDDLRTKVRKWANDALEIGKLPKRQIIDGPTTDATSIVQAAVEQMKKEKLESKENNSRLDDVMEIVGRATEDGQRQIPIQGSPISVSSPGSVNNNSPSDGMDNIIAQLGFGNGGDGGGDDGNGLAGIDNGNVNSDSNGRYITSKRNGFAFANPRNISIFPLPFTGKNLNVNPYLPFNQSLRRLIFFSGGGAGGEIVRKMLDKVEAFGDKKLNNEQLQTMINEYPRVAEFDIAITAILLNLTIGVAIDQI